jgi:hypothetical protein
MRRVLQIYRQLLQVLLVVLVVMVEKVELGPFTLLVVQVAPEVSAETVAMVALALPTTPIPTEQTPEMRAPADGAELVARRHLLREAPAELAETLALLATVASPPLVVMAATLEMVEMAEPAAMVEIRLSQMAMVATAGLEVTAVSQLMAEQLRRIATVEMAEMADRVGQMVAMGTPAVAPERLVQLAHMEQPAGAATVEMADLVAPVQQEMLAKTVETAEMVDSTQAAEFPETVATVGLAVPGTPEPTPRPALPRKAVQLVVPVVTAELAGQLVALRAMPATAAMVEPAELAVMVETASLLAINPTERTPEMRAPVETVESVQLLAHSRARYLATAATEATLASLEMVVLPLQVATVATAATVPLVEPVEPVEPPMDKVRSVATAAMAATPAMVVLPPPAERLLTALTVVTVDLAVVGMPEVPPAQLVRLPEE